MIDIAKTRFIVIAWPDNRWPVETQWWINHLTRGHAIRPDNMLSTNVDNVECARNDAIKRAINSHDAFEHFVFIDRDVRPIVATPSATDEFLALDKDVKCCRMEHRSQNAWANDESFHDALWSAPRHVLESVPPPWFTMRYNEDHTRMLGCICQSFRDRVLLAGFTIGHAGWANHDQDKSWCG
jgi:hypothetical protein